MFGAGDLPTVGAKIEGEIGDLLAKLEILKKAIQDFKKEASGSTHLRLAADMQKELDKIGKSMRSGILRKGLRAALEDATASEADRAGQNAAQRFAAAWRKQIKKEKFRAPGWLPFVGAGMLAAPSAISGALGAIGGLGSAMAGAAAGLGALAFSAAEVLGPVKQAFTTLDQMGIQNQIGSNTSALKIWLGGSTTTTRTRVGSRTFSASVLQKRIVAVQARIAAEQTRLAFAKTPVQAASAQAAILSSEATLAGLQNRLALGSGAGTFSKTTRNALGPGLGFLTNPNLNWYTLSPKQQRAAVIAAQHTTGMPTAEKALLSDLMTQRRVFGALNPGQRKALFSYMNFDRAVVKAQSASQPIVLSLMSQALGIGGPLISRYLPGLAGTAGHALQGVLGQVGTATRAPAFGAFMGALNRTAGVGIRGFGRAGINVATGLGNIFTGFSKSGITSQMVNDVVKLTGAFAKWTSGKGFAEFLKSMKANAPVILAILVNLLKIVGELVKGMSTGLGHLALVGIQLLTGALAKLASIPGLGPFVYNIAAVVLLFSKFGSLKAVTALWDLAYKGLFKLVGLRLGTFVAGVMGLETEGKTLGQIWSSVGSKIGAAAKTAVLAMGGWIKSGAVWVVNAIKQGVTVMISWIASAATAVAAWVAANATMILVSGGIVLLLAAIVVGVYFLLKHWKTVWGWITRIAKDAWNGLKKGFDDAWGFIKKIFFDGLKYLFDAMALYAVLILKVAVKMFGWVPGIGKGLKLALAAVQIFVAKTNAALDKLAHPRQIPLTFSLNLPPGVSFPQRPIKGHHGVVAGHAGGTGPGGASPGWSWVGERGPELTYFHGGETVLNNSQSMRVARGYASGTPNSNLAVATSFSSINRTMSGMKRLEDSVIAKAAAAITRAVQKLISVLGGSGGGGAGGPFPVPGGGNPAANAALARRMMPSWGSGIMWTDWNNVAMRESGWNRFARNPGSGAYGIPQALPPTKMPFAAQAAGGSNAGAQISWMINYIRGRYGSPIGAWNHELSYGWYRRGTKNARRGWAMVGEGGPELVGSSTLGGFSHAWGRGVGDPRPPWHGGAHPPGLAPRHPGPRGFGPGGPVGGPRPVNITINTNEINPEYHAAKLGFELARRSG